jgi:hypothetical protein
MAHTSVFYSKREQMCPQSTQERELVQEGLVERLSRLPLEFGLRAGNGRRLYAAASFLSRSVAIALINCGS